MPFGAHETMEVHEILNEKINLINHFSMYAMQCQNSLLRQMIERHLRSAIESYDQLVAYTHDYEAASRPMNEYGMPHSDPRQVVYGLDNPQNHNPQLQNHLDDRQIVCAMLACHKNSAKNHISSALECADPNIRQMMVHGSVACTNQAYEVFMFMNQHGIYQVPMMDEHTAKTYLHRYQPMNQSMNPSAVQPVPHWS